MIKANLVKEMRCCMCPNLYGSYKNNMLNICPGIENTHHPRDSKCKFVIVWVNHRGEAVFVDDITATGRKFICVRRTKWGGKFHVKDKALPSCKTFDEAQRKLNLFGKEKNWNIKG